jgi:RNA polymerase sigma-70 factor (ECF subfamily)
VIDPDGADASAAQKGDEEAFARLVRRHRRSLISHLRRFTGNETEIQDLVQETYLEVYRSLPTYRRLGPFSCWLRRIASRVGYRHWSGQARQVRARAAFLELQRCAAPPTPFDDTEYVRMLLDGFGRRDGLLLELRYVQGLSPTEIARKMGWKAERVRVRLHRAVKKLRMAHDSAKARGQVG